MTTTYRAVRPSRPETGAALAVSKQERVLISYARKSKRVAGDGMGARVTIARQHHDNRAYFAKEFPGVPVLELDDNLSAWDPDAYREDYETMLAMIGRGEVRATVGWHPDRYTRQPLQQETMWDLCKRSGTEFHTVPTGLVTDPLTLRILGAVAAQESDNKSRRIKRKFEQIAAEGTHRGGPRRFGFEDDGMTVRDSEAVAVREIVGRLLNGESLASCARWLNAERVPSTTGLEGKWTGPNLRQLVVRPYLAGLVLFRGEIVGTGKWAPIITEADHEALVYKLTDPARRTNMSNARVYLLAGLALCGECGRHVRGIRGGTRGDRAAYSCRHRGCGRVSRDAAAVDRWVTAWVVERLAMRDASGILEDDTAGQELAELTGSRRALDGRRTALADRWAVGDLSDEDYERRTAALDRNAGELDGRISALKETVAKAPRALEGMCGPDPVQVFTELPLGRQRQIVDVLCTVTIERAERKGAAFDRASVRIEPKLS